MRRYLKDKYGHEFTIKRITTTEDKRGIEVVEAYAIRKDSQNTTDSFKIQRNKNSNTYRDNFPERYYLLSEQARVSELVSSITNKEVKGGATFSLQNSDFSKIKAPLPSFKSFSGTQQSDSIHYKINLVSVNQQTTKESLNRHAAHLYKIWQNVDVNADASSLHGAYMVRRDKETDGEIKASDLICYFDEELMSTINDPTQLVSCFKVKGSL